MLRSSRPRTIAKTLPVSRKTKRRSMKQKQTTLSMSHPPPIVLSLTSVDSAKNHVHHGTNSRSGELSATQSLTLTVD